MNENKTYSSNLAGQQAHLQQFRLGTVVEYNPASLTIDVLLSGGDSLAGIPLLNSYGSWHSRDITQTQKLRGAAVLLIFLNGHYFFINTLPSQVESTNKEVVNPILDNKFGGSNSLTYSKGIHNNYQGGRATDLFDGDKVLSTGEDVTLGLFQGGIALLKASPLAQIVLGKYKDFIRMIGRRFQIYSDFGEMHLEHTATGRVRASLHGGANLATETHPMVTKWTVQSWLGDDPANPDNRLHIRVNDVENAKFVTLEMDINGDMFLETSNDRNAKHGNNEKIDVTNDRDITVGNNQSNSTGVDSYVDVGNNRETMIGTNDTLDVGTTLTITAGTSVIINAPSVSIN